MPSARQQIQIRDIRIEGTGHTIVVQQGVGEKHEGAAPQAKRAAGPMGANPYRGLSAFQVSEAHLFFGRATLTDKLWQSFKNLVESPDSVRLLAILGPSGSGKSSVARAGLLAALGARPVPGPLPVRTVALKPGEHPLRALALALRPPPPEHSSSPDLGALRRLIDDLGQSNKRGEFDGLTLWAANQPGADAAPLVVLVDQFEELYAPRSDKQERDAFVGLLLHAAADRGRHVAVVLTLRSDFFGETQRHHRDLNQLIAAQHELVPALSDAELRQVIAEPARGAGRELDAATVELLLREARRSEGALPLLEFALTRIWEGMQAGKEAGATLRELGGVGGALAGEAQKIYDSLSQPEQATARRALVRLVQLGEGTRDTRRRVPLRDLCGQGQTESDVLAVLRKFAIESARLVTLSGDGGEPLAEVTHEALFDHWAELRTWIEESRADRRLYDRAAEAARLWDEDKRQPGRLWRRPDLDLLQDYARWTPDEINDLLATFLHASTKQLQQEQAERERVIQIRRLLLAGILLAAMITVVIYIQKSEQIRQQLLSTYVEKGRQLLVSDAQAIDALPWLHRAQKARSTDPRLPFLLGEALRADPIQTVLIEHADMVTSARFSPDGRFILTASQDQTARLWDTRTGSLQRELKGPSNLLSTAEFSPDGRFILTTSHDKGLRLWEAQTGSLVCEQMASSGVATFSPDGRFIVMLGPDRAAEIWQTETCSLHRKLGGHSALVTGAMFSPDGRFVMMFVHDHKMEVWKAATGSLLLKLDESDSAAFSPDGRLLVTKSARKDAPVQLWEPEAGVLLHEVNVNTDFFPRVTFSPDGQFVVITSWNSTAWIWEAETSSVARELRGHKGMIHDVSFSPDGRFLVTSSRDKTARVWEAQTGALLQELKGHTSWVSSAKFSPDGRFLLTASYDKTARLWEAQTGALLQELKGHTSLVKSATFSPDGQFILTASDDQVVRVWRTASNSLLRELKGPADLFPRAMFSPEGRRIVTVGGSKLLVWETESGSLLRELQGPAGLIRSVTLSPDGRFILTANGVAQVWDAASGSLLRTFRGHSEGVSSAIYSPDGRFILTASDDKTARLWNAQTGSLLRELKGHASPVWNATFSPDGRLILTASSDKTARLWDAQSGQVLRELKGQRSGVGSATFSPDGRRILTVTDDIPVVWETQSGQVLRELKGHTGLILSATFSPDGRFVVTASFDTTARIWEAQTGALVQELKGHTDEVVTATFSPGSQFVVTASKDHTARIWETQTGSLLQEFKGHTDGVTSAAFSPDGRLLVTMSSDGTARIWDVGPSLKSPDAIGRYLSCLGAVRFEREDNDVLVATTPNPGDCQGKPRP